MQMRGKLLISLVALFALGMASACADPATAVATASTFYHASPSACRIEPMGNVAHVVLDHEKTRAGKGALLHADRPGRFDVHCGKRSFKYVVRDAARLELARVASTNPLVEVDGDFNLRVVAFDRDGGALEIGGWTKGIEFATDAASTQQSESHPLFCCSTPQQRFVATARGTTTVRATWNGLTTQTTLSIAPRRKAGAK